MTNRMTSRTAPVITTPALRKFLRTAERRRPPGQTPSEALVKLHGMLARQQRREEWTA